MAASRIRKQGNASWSFGSSSLPALGMWKKSECDWPFAELASGPWACLSSSLSISSGAPRSSGLGCWYLPSSSGPGEPFTSPNPQSRRGTGSPEPERGAFPSLPPSGCPLAPDGSLSLHRDRTGEGVVAQSRGLPEGSQGRRLGMVAWSPEPLPRVTQWHTELLQPGKKSGETP